MEKKKDQNSLDDDWLFNSEHIETIYLSKDDWEFFLNILENPPEPNDRLKKLLTSPSIFESKDIDISSNDD